MKTMYLGIDYGAKGACAGIDQDGRIIEILRMPATMDQLYAWVYTYFYDYDTEVIVYGEELSAIFGSSSKSTFNFGKNIGRALGVFECLHMHIHEIAPRTWQKFIFSDNQVPEMEIKYKTRRGQWKMKRSTKEMALVAARNLWGDEIEQYSAHDGIIDALLIAEYARRNHV